MYNNIGMYGPRELPTKVIVTERRAPTDESIALYDQIREKAFKSIIESGLEDLDHSISWVIVQDLNTFKFKYVLSFYGRSATGEIKFSHNSLQDLDDQGIAKYINERVIKHLSEEVARMITHQFVFENVGKISRIIENVKY